MAMGMGNVWRSLARAILHRLVGYSSPSPCLCPSPLTTISSFVHALPCLLTRPPSSPSPLPTPSRSSSRRHRPLRSTARLPAVRGTLYPPTFVPDSTSSHSLPIPSSLLLLSFSPCPFPLPPSRPSSSSTSTSATHPALEALEP